MSRLVLLLTLVTLLLGPLAAFPGSHARAASTPLLDTQAPFAARLQPGSTAIVSAEGDCLRVRAMPTIDGEQLGCAEHGSEVRVLEGAVEADGFTWQRIEQGGIRGWAADMYLVPSETTPVCDTRSTPPGLFGSLPAEGGPGLVTWGGGTVTGIIGAAAERGVTLRTIWVTSEARWIGYVVGAPDFVNRAWYAHFPGGRIPTGTALLAYTEPTTALTTGVNTVGALPPSRGEAPTHVGGPAPEIDAASAIVVDEASGAVLYSHNADAQLPPASLTKIVTAILAIEGSDLDAWVRTDVDLATLDADSSLMGLAAGDCFTMRDLLYGLMLRSGNDAALAIARHVAGSDEAFAGAMNALMRRFGLTDTHFANPHGLHDDAQLSTSYDLAMLTRYAMTLPTFEDISRTHAWTATGSQVIDMRTLNAFLSSYDGADGVKTGWTEEAGLTLVASATRDGQRVYAVLLNAPDRNTDAAALLEWAFTQHVWPE